LFYEQALLMGEARYTSRPLGRDTLAELGAKATRLIPSGWRAHLTLFARGGFTVDLRERAEREGVLLKISEG
jgi:hypothetical protein